MIHVRDAKTEAGVRQVNMTPWLHDELLAYRATRADAELDEPAFPTRTGARRDQRPINRKAIAPAVRAANAIRAERRQLPIPGSITAHTFRRTFITLISKPARRSHTSRRRSATRTRRPRSSSTRRSSSDATAAATARRSTH
ncbi:MAG: hypothetical protein JO321_01020 [Solirubrobacterales bacterium]|nr:hypothetical protein [Solirubrobacterales bacterium]MBV9533972.1 hypothetical protein [Solirubrobacterales bacterium]